MLTSVAQYRSLHTKLVSSGRVLVSVINNPVDTVWAAAGAVRTLPTGPIFHLAERFNGQSTAAKLAVLRQGLASKSGAVVVLTALDEIAWLFNLRGISKP